MVFSIEGEKTGVKEIRFVGNSAISSTPPQRHDDDRDQPAELPQEHGHLRSDRLAADQELIRRYYLKNGYADFQLLSRMRCSIRTPAATS